MNYLRMFYASGTLFFMVQNAREYQKTNNTKEISTYVVKEIGIASLFWPVIVSLNYFNKNDKT